MADIAFLLLIFFLVTTTIVQDKGLYLVLPPDIEEQPDAPIHDRNLFTVQINSAGGFLIEGKVRENINGLDEEIAEFILNPNNDATLSDSPLDAVVSYKTSRKATQGAYVEVLDVIFRGYNMARAETLGITLEELKSLNKSNPADAKVIEKAKELVPRRLSIAD